MDLRLPDFENDDVERSDFIRALALRQVMNETNLGYRSSDSSIPRTLVRYWHNLDELPEDVAECLRSWDHLSHDGFVIETFDDVAAKTYIAAKYGSREVAAFARCRHPAMRSDYFRMCFLLAEGGMYVDADDVLLGDQWTQIFRDGRLKLQPLCYDISSSRMAPASHIWLEDTPSRDRVFYVNNDPLAAPANHPLLARALASSTEKLLGGQELPIIQATTGPGNMTVSLAFHAYDLLVADAPPDFELLRNWDQIAETRWDLSYRGDDRNWRNVQGSGF